MRYCSQHWLDRRCREAGRRNGECDGCIVERGDVLKVDETHQDFPNVPATAALPQQAPPQPLPDLSRTDAPSFLTKVKNFAVSAAKHVAAGMPMASDEEIIRRHDICMGCEFMKDNACTKCGCPVKRAKEYVSKLSWADQECPIGKWGKALPANKADTGS